MIAEVMLDTNVLAYAVSRATEDQGKSSAALRLIASERFGISGQVLQEFYVTTTKKLRTPLTHEQALDWIESLEQFPCVAVDSSLVYQGAETAKRHRISYWDGTIIAAAERLGAAVLYTEDLNHDQLYGTVRAINPFRET